MVVTFIVLGVAAWVGALMCLIRANRSFYPWHRPLAEAGILPPNSRGPALATWRRLLGNRPEQDATAEAYRLAARGWAIRMFGLGALFVLCLGLAWLAAFASPLAAARAGSSPRPPTVPCGDEIARLQSGRGSGYRIVLGVVSVPPSRLRQVIATHRRPWPYWRKAGIAVHAGTAGVSQCAGGLAGPSRDHLG